WAEQSVARARETEARALRGVLDQMGRSLGRSKPGRESVVRLRAERQLHLRRAGAWCGTVPDRHGGGVVAIRLRLRGPRGLASQRDDDADRDGTMVLRGGVFQVPDHAGRLGWRHPLVGERRAEWGLPERDLSRRCRLHAVRVSVYAAG